MVLAVAVVHTYNSRRGGWYWLWYIPMTLGGVGGTGCGFFPIHSL